MAKHVINDKRTDTLSVNEVGSKWIVSETGFLDVKALVGIYISNGFDGNDIEVHGRVRAGAAAIDVTADDIDIVIGSTGVLEGGRGIYLSGIESSVINDGEIHGKTEGIYRTTGDVDIVNLKGGVIEGDRGIAINNASGTLVNKGYIEGKIWALEVGTGTLKVVNSGTFDGVVRLGDGDDLFVSKGGSVTEYVYGGQGDDTFRLLSGEVLFKDPYGGGTDTLQTAVSYNLKGSGAIDIMAGIGSKDIRLVGNNEKQQLIGNRGDNILIAKDGDDLLVGGKGEDRLTGGDGEDTFSFRDGFGRDVITDFEIGVERINLEHYTGVDGFDDLIAVTLDGNVYIEMPDGGKLALLGLDSLNLDDFHFSVV